MPLESDVPYECPYCWEQNYLGVDPTGGARQDLVEDCPVCCRPIAFLVRVDREGTPFIETAEASA